MEPLCNTSSVGDHVVVGEPPVADSFCKYEYPKYVLIRPADHGSIKNERFEVGKFILSV